MNPVTIVDYGMGNLGSIHNMLRRAGATSVISGDAAEIARATKLILPGVGRFDAAMQEIDARGLRSVLNHKALTERVPILGLCLGMQLLGRGSEEGARPGLGWVAAEARRFSPAGGLKVPHMGWNQTSITHHGRLAMDVPEDARFYFVHSYYMVVDEPTTATLTASYGVTFVAAIEEGNIFGTQFHPEKSHRFGLQVLTNFTAL